MSRVLWIFRRWVEFGALAIGAFLVFYGIEQPPPAEQALVVTGPIQHVRMYRKSIEFVVGSTTLSMLNSDPGYTQLRRALKEGALVDGTAWHPRLMGDRYSILDMSVGGVHVVSRSSSVGFHRFGSGLCFASAACCVWAAVWLLRQPKSVWDVHRAVEKKKRENALSARRSHKH